MKSANNWRDFEIIATGGGEKLERWGAVYLLRPDPQAIWRARFDFRKYPGLDGIYTRSPSGGGAWAGKMPDEWVITYNSPSLVKGGTACGGVVLKFIISPMNFKHTGLFPEQAVNWDVIASACEAIPNGPTVLNLFAYTGGATVAAAKAGAHVTHVDASKGMVEVCKRNCKLNNLNSVRFIVDDCIKFVEREIRRGKKYDAIIMDPPTFGRGANGEVWKIEESLDYLVSKCCELLSDKPLFFLINSYTTGLQPQVLKNILQLNLKEKFTIYNLQCTIEGYEIGLPTGEGIVLPAGCSALATFKKG